ncbi:zinc finger protein jing [Caerostris darwini]|uniref:Zinc finger protein jing n=1 Tax=Caerostris darwini TaxID=1538125 RepID=A0AAV4UEZ7_9ARAC|nr:zinc finger protein jing [Caerostris darwini]
MFTAEPLYCTAKKLMTSAPIIPFVGRPQPSLVFGISVAWLPIPTLPAAICEWLLASFFSYGNIPPARTDDKLGGRDARKGGRMLSLLEKPSLEITSGDLSLPFHALLMLPVWTVSGSEFRRSIRLASAKRADNYVCGLYCAAEYSPFMLFRGDENFACGLYCAVDYSVVTTSGGESSEPSSPSRPATPMPPLPTQHCPYECLRADSEDSGLGPSPAKSLVQPTSPASPLHFCNDSDSLLDLSPRTDNSYESDKGPEEPYFSLDKTPAKSGSAFKFLLSSASANNRQTTQFPSPLIRGGESSAESSPPPFCEDDHPFQSTPHGGPEDFNRETTPSPLLADGESSTSPSSFFDEQACRELPFQTTGSPCRQTTQFPSPLLGGDEESSTSPNSFFDEQSASRDEDPAAFQPIQNSHLNRLNPQVLLIRSNFNDGAVGFQESTTTGSDCTSSNCSQVDPQGSVTSSNADDGDCKWLGCNRLADDNTTETDLVDHIRQCHVQSQPDDCKSYVCLWVGCKVYERASCSRSWLERHVLLHGGSKPFRCIVDGCRQRFGSEGALERHVNSHFPHKERPHRLCRRRRHKHRKRPQSSEYLLRLLSFFFLNHASPSSLGY